MTPEDIRLNDKVAFITGGAGAWAPASPRTWPISVPAW